MRICYLPIFLAMASAHVSNTRAQQLRLDGGLSALMGTVMTIMMPSEVTGVFTDSFQHVFSNAPVNFPSLGSLVTLSRKRRYTSTLEAQLKRIQNEVDTLERMMDGGSEAPLRSAEASRVRRESEEGDSADPQGKAMEVAGKGAEMAGNGMESAKQGSKMASDGAQSAKSGADTLGNGAEMIGKGAEVFGAGMEKGKETATSFSG